MRKILLMHLALPFSLLTIFITMLALTSCGGGGGGNEGGNGGMATSNSSATSSSVSTAKLSGKITYDYVPHNSNSIGLNYAAIEQRPVRGVVVELIDETSQVRASTITDAEGTFSVIVEKNINLRVRAKAQLLNNSSPAWDFKVTDNTSNNALYVLDGVLASTGATDSVRMLHANSGWGGVSYTGTRAAAPFAILDTIYTGITRLKSVGSTQSLSPLELRWSTKNSAANGDYEKGEIETSFYDGSAIYILGDANNDTDEYDAHVLLHEWGHYVEYELFRSDSIGGEHDRGEFLDMRVAMSEGFANAFSGMMIDSAIYADAFGTAQSSGFTFDVAHKKISNKGYFNEGSIGSIFYNFYTNNENKVANDFTPIFNVLSSTQYKQNDAMTSIYLFYSQLINQAPQYSSSLQTLMQEQEIWGVDQYGLNESNSGGLAIQLPIYKKLDISNGPVTLCTSNQYGEANKLGNSQFVRISINQAGAYTFRLVKSSDSNLTTSKPEFILHLKGLQVSYAPNIENNSVVSVINLAAGNYVLEVYDRNYRDDEPTAVQGNSCFDVQVTKN